MPRITRSWMTKRSSPDRHGRQPRNPGSSGMVRLTLRMDAMSSKDVSDARLRRTSEIAALLLIVAFLVAMGDLPLDIGMRCPWALVVGRTRGLRIDASVRGGRWRVRHDGPPPRQRTCPAKADR